jgi:hypothetical protein
MKVKRKLQNDIRFGDRKYEEKCIIEQNLTHKKIYTKNYNFNVLKGDATITKCLFSSEKII